MPNITSEFHSLAQASSPVPKTNIKPVDAANKVEYDIYTKEAYRIYQHIDSLSRFLHSIRRAYLNNDNRKSRSLHSKHNVQPSKPSATLSAAPVNTLFAMFPTNISYLTNKERDEIDFQAKLIIRRCMDRIKELEEAERLRKEQDAATAARRFAHFLKQVTGTPSSESEDILAIHRSNMIWLLNKLLADVSKLQKNQQEIRLTRELEKSGNHLFNNVYLSSGSSSTGTSDNRSNSNNINAETSGTGSIKATDIAVASSPLGLSWKPTKSTLLTDNTETATVSAPSSTWESNAHEEMDAFEQQLSQEQIQELEKENEAMLEEMNSTLNQVRQAEKALMEISTLQSQLTNHLAVQTMQTDRLYGDSLATTERVEQGNMQLQQAKERNRGTRKFMLIFLLGASFVLLFLDWYS